MVKVTLVDHCDVVPDLVELFNLVFAVKITAEMWEWKHLQNPLNRVQPRIVVALDGKRIVGARPFMPVNLRVHNRTLLAGQPCDTMVHPEYRRQGIFGEMNNLVIEHARAMGVSLFYNFPNPFTLAGNLKQGWRKIIPIESLMRFEKPVEVASAKFGGRLASKFVGTCYGRLFGAVPRRQSYDKGQAWRIQTSDKVVEPLDGLSQLYHEDRIELDRSLSYLEWRIDRHPGHEYRYVMCLQDDKLIGYVLVGLSTWNNGLRVGQIVDYLMGCGNADCIFDMFDGAILELLNMGCDMLSIWAPADETIRDTLKRFLGFRSSFDFPLRLAFRGRTNWLVARELNESLSEYLCVHDPDAWRLTSAFSDLA